MKTLVLKLRGPMQSYGTHSHFNTRETDSHPSKSAVLGLIAGALGWRRSSEQLKPLESLQFAVRVDQAGLTKKDYQIAQKYKRDGTFDKNYVTNRYYVEDAIFVVALGHEDDQLIDTIEKALRRPYFQGFLGRRSYPVNYDLVMYTSDQTPLEELKTLDWQAEDWYRNRQSAPSSLEIFADKALSPNAPGQKRQDAVVSFSQEHRQFAYRLEVRLLVPPVLRSSEHDAFGEVGES